MGSDWTYLETAKLCSGLLTPILVVWLGYMVKLQLSRIEKSVWLSNRLIDQRIQIYSALSPMLNRLLQFYIYVGEWESIKPVEVIGIKRKADELVFSNAQFLGDHVLKQYSILLDAMFTAYSGHGEPAKIRAHFKSRTSGTSWQSEWEELFDVASRQTKEELSTLYWSFNSAIADSIGVDFDPKNVERLLLLHPPKKHQSA